jgi:long-chain acyl-CoA synthetase
MTSIEEHLADLHARWAESRRGRQPETVAHRAGERTVPGYVRHWARETPERPAFVAHGQILTYRELDDATDRLAGWLESQGVRPGDHVAVHLPNSVFFAVVFLAILRLGAVHVPVNPMLKAEEVRYELDDAGAESVLSFGPLREVLDGIDVRAVFLDDEWAAILDHPPLATPAEDLDALAALHYTGGTTGMPKGVEHTQRHMVHTATAIQNGLPGAEDGIVSLCHLPVYWIAGENLGLLAPLVSGGTGVLLTRWDAAATLRLIEEHKVTTMAGTVENYLELRHHPDFPHRDLSSLTAPLVVSFMRKLTPDLRADWRKATGGVLREASYGMTETHSSDTSTLGFQDGDRDLLGDPVFCGLPVPGTELMVVDFTTGEPMPIGEPGEIVVRGPSVLTRYWRAPEATAQALRNGWLHTGDIGSLDEEGCLRYLGRNKDMIKVKGMSVFPTEVETLLGRHPAVLAAAVVAVEDEERGQLPYAFVRTVPGAELTADELRAWARTAMATYKVPLVELVPELPLTPTGKIRKTELSARASRTRTAP